MVPIEESKLRRIVAAHAAGHGLSAWPVPAAMIRAIPVGADAHERTLAAMRALCNAAARVASVTDDPFYGSLPTRPDVAVAGTKNGFRLRGLETQWVEAQRLYRCVWHELVPGSALLDSLLHGCRGLPGLPVLPVCPAWPSFDDPMVVGYLTAQEVHTLDSTANDLGHNMHARMLRAIIGRAAAAGLALVTLHGI